MTLIEVIGVLAVMSVLAAIALPAMLKEIDKAAADQEIGMLQSFDNALKKSIRRNHAIPSATNWASVVSIELGLDMTDVVTNKSRQPRYFVIDPALTNSFNLPYTQNNAGSATPPTGARVMLLSSLGRPLTGIASGLLTSGDFNVIWNTADGIVPSATVFTGWGGKGEDLKVHRIQLAPLFVRLILNYYASTNCASYRLDEANPTDSVTSVSGVDGYFIQGSVLNLYSGCSPVTLDSQQILNHDNSFWYYQNSWRGLMPGFTGVPGATNQAGAFDFSTIVNGFLASPSNSVVGATSQPQVVQSFMTYMSNYNAWAASNFTDSGLKTATLNAQSAMVTVVGKLYAPPYDPPPGP